MSNLHAYLWLIPTLPLLAAAVIAFLGPRFLRGHSHWPCVAAVAVSCVLSFLLLYAGWEGVGLCSYLLIGFWFQKPSAADAARKAFLVTRLGDLGMLLGIILLWWLTGHYGQGSYSLDYDGVFSALRARKDDPT